MSGSTTGEYRREFLGRCGMMGLGFFVGAGSGMAKGSAPQWLWDAKWKKHGELFRHEGEPAGGWVQNFTSTVEAIEGDRWRIWTSVSVPKSKFKQMGFHEGKVGGEWKRTLAVCTPGEPDEKAALAIGGLPEGWHPVQGVTLRLKDGRTRIYFWAHGEGIVRYLAADSDDGRAFKVVNALQPCIYHPADRAVDGKVALELGLKRFAKRKAAPADGEDLAPSRLITNDATNVYQLPDGSFEMFTVGLIQVGKDDPRYAANDNIAGMVRVIDRYVSEDGLRWGDRRRVLVPDERDPHDLQFYYLSVTHTEQGRIGLLGHYRLGAQTIDIEPCFSTDGIHWERPLRKPLISRDEAKVTVASYILHAPHAMVKRDGLWHLFYTGGNFAHNHLETHGTPDRAVMLASCSAD
ncbi:hypothetical protein FEM03_17370 [Phragmitibacter flavus]|uniref:Exo-alpha-sialidase n=1 Tax=Phragmitibacter flavus TaxID=2576071 RepID=A0A5R8KAU3_9BACT|nr:hypothetical protein [Phragmitibacter flavus]TLD69416.1 hypothetical protein FEM03_17370 [Phragmitibacter flavus]